MVFCEFDQMQVKQERNARRTQNLFRKRVAYHNAVGNRIAKQPGCDTVGAQKHASFTAHASRIHACRARRHVSPHGRVRAATRTQLSRSAIEVNTDMPATVGSRIKGDIRKAGLPKLRVSPSIRMFRSSEIANVSTYGELSDIDDVLEECDGALLITDSFSNSFAGISRVLAAELSSDFEALLVSHDVNAKIQSERFTATVHTVFERTTQIVQQVVESTWDEAVAERSRITAEGDEKVRVSAERLACSGELENEVNVDRSRTAAEAGMKDIVDEALTNMRVVVENGTFEAATHGHWEEDTSSDEKGSDRIFGTPKTNQPATDAAYLCILEDPEPISRGEERFHALGKVLLSAKGSQSCCITDSKRRGGDIASLIPSHSHCALGSEVDVARAEEWEVLDEVGSPTGTKRDMLELSNRSTWKTMSDHFAGWTFVS
eukprot:TRINITY_DN16658_c0_g1_i1.p1 TRINITY_DN16658_c0_g1~~TRINITY_DN16658_c0_g1_i1.p1  ORF type:complete len:433 (-),score=54.73 TRINITY_DN16658_c0_g1_i1:514-1812(-)